jgi:hypothetical protein
MRETEIRTEIMEESALAFLQACYRNPSLNLTTRARIAIACLPFESPKLAVVAQITESDIATVLDRRIARYQQMRLLENKPVTQEKVVSEPSLIEEPKPSPPTPAPLNRLYNKKLYRRI